MENDKKLIRLDELLKLKKIVESRNKAMTLIKENMVEVNSKIINKPSLKFYITDDIKLLNNLKYVSRAGVKLESIINDLKIEIKNKTILDIGSSTGGFSDVCLQKNAKKIYCIDIGADQLHHKIKEDKRVIDLSPLNIKNLNRDIIKDEIDIIVSDLSFISSTFMFEAINKINLSKDIHIITLIKPQFELTKEIINRHKGAVKDPKYHQVAIDRVVSCAHSFNYKCLKISKSPILGAKKNNEEFLGVFICNE